MRKYEGHRYIYFSKELFNEPLETTKSVKEIQDITPKLKETFTQMNISIEKKNDEYYMMKDGKWLIDLQSPPKINGYIDPQGIGVLECLYPSEKYVIYIDVKKNTVTLNDTVWDFEKRQVYSKTQKNNEAPVTSEKEKETEKEKDKNKISKDSPAGEGIKNPESNGLDKDLENAYKKGEIPDDVGFIDESALEQKTILNIVDIPKLKGPKDMDVIDMYNFVHDLGLVSRSWYSAVFYPKTTGEELSKIKFDNQSYVKEKIIDNPKLGDALDDLSDDEMHGLFSVIPNAEPVLRLRFKDNQDLLDRIKTAYQTISPNNIASK